MKPNSAETESLRTWGRGRAVRLDADLYAMDLPIHLTICALTGNPFEKDSLAQMTCTAIERTCTNLRYSLFAYCLMPDHLHVLLSPTESEVPIAEFLRRFKSYTTRQYQNATGIKRLWQYSARDSIVWKREKIRTLVTYIANNPVRAELVERWVDWPYTKVFVE